MAWDIIIIGAGPGGYVMAESAGRRDLRVLLVEMDQLGGVCRNRGCIPTKTLLNSAKHYVHAGEASDFGVTAHDIRFDLAKAMAWKSEVVQTLRGGVAHKMKNNGVTVVKGRARLVGPRRVRIGDEVHEADNVVIATGGSPLLPAIPGVDQPHVVTSDTLLEIDRLPESLMVIGGGVIGIEFASLFSSLGVRVDVIEMLDEIVPFMDPEHAAKAAGHDVEIARQPMTMSGRFLAETASAPRVR